LSWLFSFKAGREVYPDSDRGARKKSWLFYPDEKFILNLSRNYLDTAWLVRQAKSAHLKCDLLSLPNI
jgi:hypothetical protein